jgi:hypothetical protein
VGVVVTPILKGAADDEGLIVLKVVEPEPPIHWIWKWIGYGLPLGTWLALLVGVLVDAYG